MGDNSVEPKPTVVVTGFGPFGSHVVNASWVAVQEMEKLGLGTDAAELVTMEIPVEYDHVKKNILPDVWDKYKPKLVVHVGVSGIAKELTLEQQAHNDGYDKYDVLGQFPKTMCCVDGGADCLVSRLDMRKACSAVNDAKCGVDAVVSLDPGRYLCDYIYYTSLSVNSDKTAFIHVPPLNKPYSAAELGKGIRLAVLNMLEQLQ